MVEKEEEEEEEEREEKKYELQFFVSDRVWRQIDVEANVTVEVRLLTPDTLTHAAPLTLSPVTSAQLTRGWTPKGGGGGLGRLMEAVKEVVGGQAEHSVEVVSVYDLGDQLKEHDISLHQQHTTTIIHDTQQPQQQLQHERISKPGNPSYDYSSHQHQHHHQQHTTTTSVPHLGPPWLQQEEGDGQNVLNDATQPSACVWVSVREPPQGRFMDPIKLQGLLGLHTNQLEVRTGLTVVAEDPRVSSSLGAQQQQNSPRDDSEGASLPIAVPDPSSVATSPSTALPLQVVDTNTTSLVTPRLTRAHPCYAHDPETCTPTSCLNGGRCIRTPQGNRCVCPQGSSGPRCKVLARSFFGSGWAWVRPLPPCLPTTLSLRVLTRRPDALLLYSGPLAPHPRRPHHPPTPMLALQLLEGRPEVLLEGAGGPLRLVVNTTVHDGDWHSLHLHVHSKGVVVLVDMCGRGWEEASDDSHCVTRASWTNTVQGAEAWAGAWPVQVGGLAHKPPLPEDHGWGVAPTPTPLHGCISHLTLNGQLVDVGEPAYSWASKSGCQPQETSCPRDQGGCGYRGTCVGGLNQPHCECEPGWAGSGCATPTVPASLGTSSYLKVALSFTPDPRKVWVQVRVRTRGQRNGQLLHLAAQQRAAAFTLHLRAGVACASVSGAGLVARVACVNERPVGDGAWHTIQAERHGHNLVVSVDDGDGWGRNESLVSLLPVMNGDDDDRPVSPPAPLEIDKHDGVTVGGMPEFAGVSLIAVHNDLRDTCVDDLRVSGRPLPLPPGMNGTSWGQVTTSASVDSGCVAPDACLNTTCSPPLTCTNNWGHAACSCGLGRHLSGHNTCEDLDECLWSPCLHGGTCYNLRPGYQCVCKPTHAGDNCQWTSISTGGHPLAAPVAIAALTVSLLLLVVLGVFLSVRLRRQLLGRALSGRQVRDVGGEEEVAMTVKVAGCTDEGGGGGGGGKSTARHDTFLECIKYNLQQPPLSPPPSPPPPPRKKGQITVPLGEPDVACTQPGREESCRPPQGKVTKLGPPPDPVLPRDDLRAYAYEGDGSSSGSLGSAKSGLRSDLEDEASIKPLVCEFLEVMDLLRNLPEASKSPALFTRRKARVEKEENGSSVDRPPDQTTTHTVPLQTIKSHTITTTTPHPVPLQNIKSHTITATSPHPVQSQTTKTYVAAPNDQRKALKVSSTPCSSPGGRDELSTPC
ncbi:hypothetical protein Pmani_037361 [Petrolisthes manimaculis]|uniref:Neural-cadherin n=1 Tax=Petrolisthes manimaculis TaxID=1843537 RepID=A0AAE1TNC4_9EUCA|nr:hypothetical protein Pmani_037361 [Petrolisthes manimaculis]